MSNPLNDTQPLIPSSKNLPELTFKAIVLSIFLAIVLAASNAYLALKIGTTLAAAIPASVLSIGILRFFKNSNVLESNLAQTAASAGEGLAAAIAFVLPAMIILNVWHHFPYWETVIVTLLGGFLGVLFSIPLRRVMLSLPNLRFPEGTATGNVLKVSAKASADLKMLVQGGLVGGGITFLQMGLKVIADSLEFWMVSGKALLGSAIGFSTAPLAAGYIIGIETGISLLVGLLVGWAVVLPFIAVHYGIPTGLSHYEAAMTLWSKHLRFVGVGTMLVGGLWTLFRLVKPVFRGLKSSFSSFKKRAGAEAVERTERDIPMTWVLVGVLAVSVFAYAFIMHYFLQYHFPYLLRVLLFVGICTVLFILIVGFILATISSYFCGLIGSTNNPMSGLTLISILTLSLLYLLFFRPHLGAATLHLAAIVILVAAVLAGTGAIAGENIQDLKAGHMVGATPWKQQLMMMIGVCASALVIGPILQLLFDAYGIAGVYPHEGMDPSHMLVAPQAGLMGAVAQGVLTHHLQWNLVFLGCGIAALVICVDEFLKRRNHRLPALAVGLGIYLPPEMLSPIVVGGLINWMVKRYKPIKNAAPEEKKVIKKNHQSAILLACGMVAGSSIMGVLLAIPFVLLGSADALSVMPEKMAPVATVLGLIMLLLVCKWFYRVGTGKTQ